MFVNRLAIVAISAGLCVAFSASFALTDATIKVDL